MRIHPQEYILEQITLAKLTFPDILRHSFEALDSGKRGFFDVQPQSIEIDSGIFINPSAAGGFPEVSVSQIEGSLVLSCPCSSPKRKLCEHQAQVLFVLMDKPYLRIFFDAALRHTRMQQTAKDYGLENETNLDQYFKVEYTQKAVEITPKAKELLAVNPTTNAFFTENLLPKKSSKLPDADAESESRKTIIVFRKHRYYDQFNVELFEAQTSKDGKIKNPLTALDPLPLIWKTDRLEVAKFYTGISKFQNQFATTKSDSDIEGLKMIVSNPLGLSVYYHDATISENITANSLVSARLELLNIDLNLTVDLRPPFYEISGEMMANGKAFPLSTVNIKYDYFVQIGNNLNLITNTDMLRVLEFFKKNNPITLIHTSKFEEFKTSVLDKLEHQIQIKYSYIQPASPEQIVEQGFDQSEGRIIYLQDSENYVTITPVMRYGNIEIPVFSRKQIQDTDPNGNVFKVERNNEAEAKFTALIMRQHPEFEEQIQSYEYFYLHKNKFLDETWFLDAFEVWKSEGIAVLGFNDLQKNKLNPNKATVSVSVVSGVDWFNAALAVKFGKQKATLKALHKSLRNKSKYVQLDDGTLGILPNEWLKRLEEYLEAGEVVEEEIRIPKSNFEEIKSLFNTEILGQELMRELDSYSRRFQNIQDIAEVEVPAELNATLRDYQKQGLNWLNFLDDLNFGACLADDMGLGKTIQIIAFILLQRKKQTHNTNLVVVPTSLLFNWQNEVEKFAPSIKIFTHYSASRVRDRHEFDGYEIVLTTYGMLLSDVDLLRKYKFNYIFLDESQAIKNPDSQRYKAARMIQARNRVVLTGTPLENNTFDIFGQLSFACPGLLGNKQNFRDIYSTPIDVFEDNRRAVELQRKIKPFILRRTKKQVATELPQKTEMVIYCEMGTEQRRIYDAYEKELREYVSAKGDDELQKNSMHVLTGLTKLRQICNAPSLLKDELFHGEHSAKIEVLMEQIESKAEGHKILVFSQFVAMLDLIKAELQRRNIPFEYLTGQTRNRESVVNSFQDNPAIRVFLISLKAGGTGLNLTEADYVYLVDPWWNPAVENQAIDRSYRIGQNKNVIAIRLICPDTVEEKIMKLQRSKTKLAGDLIKTDAGVVKLLKKGELMEMLG